MAKKVMATLKLQIEAGKATPAWPVGPALGQYGVNIMSFVKEFFEVKNVRMRFRPSHFPFTEPSAEVDIGYRLENGKIVIGEGDKWLEILGCGMVHPNVLKNVNVNPDKYQG